MFCRYVCIIFHLSLKKFFFILSGTGNFIPFGIHQLLFCTVRSHLVGVLRLDAPDAAGGHIGVTRDRVLLVVV